MAVPRKSFCIWSRGCCVTASTRRRNWRVNGSAFTGGGSFPAPDSSSSNRSEEHTSELQSLRHLVCRLLLEKYGDHRDLHSFPTRRSSDLRRRNWRVNGSAFTGGGSFPAPDSSSSNWLMPMSASRTENPDRKSTRLNSS